MSASWESTPAWQLIREGDGIGRVTGAYGLKEDGTYIKVNASKGALLDTSDFHQNDAMLQDWLPCITGDLLSRNSYGTAQGDGQEVAW